jgi:hypothetical protein
MDHSADVGRSPRDRLRTRVRPDRGEFARSAEENFVGPDEEFLHEHFLHHELQVVVLETGTGLTTGARYRSHDVNHESFNSPTVPALNFTFTYNETYYFISPTPGLSFRGQFFFHYAPSRVAISR